MLRRVNIRAALAAAAAAVGTGAAIAWACGPFFPNRLLAGGDHTVLWAPVADFTLEIARLKPVGAPVFRAVPPPCYQGPVEQTADADLSDLRAALERMNVPARRRDELVAAHQEVRDVLRAHASARIGWEEKGREQTKAPILAEPVSVPDDLPAEFAMYLRGAVAYHREELDAARDAWRAVLELPADQRHFRSTWAAFMLGKSWLKSDPDGAVEQFQRVRALARDGFADRLGLASSSLGWEAQAELARDRVERAVELYFQQYASDDPTAVWSLRLVAGRILKGGEDMLRRAALDDATRRLVTAYLLAHGGPKYCSWDAPMDTLVQQWLARVEEADAKDLAGADRMAWVAYQAGAFEYADRWLALARPSSGISHWIRAKLLLRAGKVDEATTELAAAVYAFPSDESWHSLTTWFGDGYGKDELAPRNRALGELGLLRLSRRQYVEALDALLRGSYWLDAAYVAERVLTIDELAEYVSTNWPAVNADIETATLGPPPEWPSRSQDEGHEAHDRRVANHRREEERRERLRATGETNVRIRHLLARRMNRDQRWAEARTFFPRMYQGPFDDYVRSLRLGQDPSQPATDRARALWTAARLTRYRGIELLGTELEPDWYAAHEGNYEMDRVPDIRAPEHDDPLTGATDDELDRAQTSAIALDKRWHYRYLAAELGWQAAALLPDDSDETARVLCEAGSWLKARDPQFADRFYKALVRRCGKTDLGREADRIRWFPPLPRSAASE